MNTATFADEKNIAPNAYRGPGYETPKRFMNYYHQIDEIRRCEPNEILKIGIGNGFLAEYLLSRCYTVVTADINEQLEPDVVASIRALPFADRTFDLAAAFEILEHLPLKSFSPILRELHRIVRDAVILSVPNCTPAYPIQITLPYFGRHRWIIERHCKAGKWASHHHWEIGHDNLSLSCLLAMVENSGFVVESSYRIFENPYCHMFVLKRS